MKPALFVTGASGLLGLNAVAHARDEFRVSGCFRTHPVTLPGADLIPLDLTSRDAVRDRLETQPPDLVLHTAGFTSVDGCEADPAEAERQNVDAARIVAEEARRAGARLIHVSTDHLWDGTAAWMTEEDPPNPVNAYGRTKGAAEVAVAAAHPDALIVRTNFYGWGTPLKASFSDWILQGLAAGTPLRMFTDVHFTPILIQDLLRTSFELSARGARGIWHVAGSERLSKFDFGVRAATVFGYPAALIEPVEIASVALRARRPDDMSLSTERVAAYLGRRMGSVTEGLEELKRLGEAGWPGLLREATGS